VILTTKPCKFFLQGFVLVKNKKSLSIVNYQLFFVSLQILKKRQVNDNLSPTQRTQQIRIAMRLYKGYCP